MNRQILRNIVFAGLFLIPFIPFLVSSSFFFPFITTKAFTWRILIEIVFALWLILAFLDTSYRPKRSFILFVVLAFLAIIGLADIFGVAPGKSFWSNFERMEGYLALLHLGMFFVVISSVFREIDWNRWWKTSLVASFLLALYVGAQVAGLLTINQGGVRADGTFGNAIYLAVYMLFHIFIAILFLWRERKSVVLRWLYGLLIIVQVLALYYTATRGATLGLLGGLLLVAILSLRNGEDPGLKKVGTAVLLGLVVLVGGFFAIKDLDFVQNSPVLSRFSSLSLEEIKTQGRYFIWPMALEGVKERPLLGWGQENFSYVFQEHYRPEMFRLEPWFDRAHNIFLDWLIAGGVLGLVAYLALYLALLFYIWKSPKDSGLQDRPVLSYSEKTILTALVVAYFFHNFFVFDHLTSYVLFFSLLAYIHSRSETKAQDVAGRENSSLTKAILSVAVFILLVASVYFFNIKPMKGNLTLINALQSLQASTDYTATTELFQQAYSSSSLGRPEIVERMTASATAILTSSLSMEEKNSHFVFISQALGKLNEDLPNDARYRLLAGSFFSSVGLFDEALINLEEARRLIPGKQQVYFELGSLYINNSEFAKALEVFQEAFELAPDYRESRIIYLIGAIYADNRTLEEELGKELSETEEFFDDRLINAYYNRGRIEEVKRILNGRIKLDPSNQALYLKDLETLAK